jgi:hypothetical protein
MLAIYISRCICRGCGLLCYGVTPWRWPWSVGLLEDFSFSPASSQAGSYPGMSPICVVQGMVAVMLLGLVECWHSGRRAGRTYSTA